MQFGNPKILWLLALLPLLGMLGAWAQSRRRQAFDKIGTRSVVSRLFPESVFVWRSRRIYAGLALFLLLTVSAARPQYGRIEQVIRRAGVDVLIALDVSNSMLAQDVKPNRLAKAKESLKVLVRSMKGNRVGIIAFAGDAFLNCPMTADLALADLVLESLDEKSIGSSGTDLGLAIRKAQGAFERGGLGTGVLVLLTDGEDNEGKGLQAAKEAAEAGMKIFCIGIGTEAGAPVPDLQKGGFIETQEGTKVSSRMDISSLSSIAKATGGSAYKAGTNPAAAVDAVIRSISQLQKTESESSKMVIHQDRFGWFLVPAILSMIWLLLSRPEKTGREHLILNGANYADAKP